MAYDFTTANSQFLTTGSTPITSEPLTIAVWFNRKNTSAQHAIVGVDRGTQAGNGFHAIVCPPTTSTINAVSNDGTASAALSTATYTLNTWNHGCGVFSSSNNRSIYLNGFQDNTSITNRNVRLLSNISIGARYAGGIIGATASCLIAEVGIWNIALTAAEIASLAKGMTCDKIRPQSLVFYAPLVRDLIDAKGGRTITNNNGATVANHPRVYA
jgi:hypothetical protein